MISRVGRAVVALPLNAMVIISGQRGTGEHTAMLDTVIRVQVDPVTAGRIEEKDE